MGKLTSSTALPIVSQRINEQKPIDDRFVVAYQEDLFNAATWCIGSSTTPYVYYGMCVSVVGETGASADKNGLYVLKSRGKYQKQSWDSAAANYDEDGWRRVIDNTNVPQATNAQIYMDQYNFNGTTGTQTNPYAVVQINGGIIT